MEPRIQTASILYDQGRYELAEKEISQHLAAHPDSAFGHSLLALCLMHRGRLDDAEKSARTALGYAPNATFSYCALAEILSSRGQLKQALSAIDSAIQIDPWDADLHGTRADILQRQRNWQDALAAAETGLQCNPQHDACINLRALALVKLGRGKEADATLEFALAHNPENSLTHANAGWALLHSGKDRKKAMVHFQESLRLDPTNEWARAGIVEALKAGNPIYGVMLRYFLWMSRLSAQAQWGIVIGGFLGNRFLGSLLNSHPEWAFWIRPLRWLYITFALLTWIADPLFNLLLRLNRFGRLALTPEQTRTANGVGLWFAAALIACLTAWVFHSTDLLLAAAMLAATSVPFAAIANSITRSHRVILGLLTSAMGGLACFVFFSTLIRLHLNPRTPFSHFAVDGSVWAINAFALLFFLTPWIANFLALRQSQR